MGDVLLSTGYEDCEVRFQYEGLFDKCVFRNRVCNENPLVFESVNHGPHRDHSSEP